MQSISSIQIRRISTAHQNSHRDSVHHGVRLTAKSDRPPFSLQYELESKTMQTWLSYTTSVELKYYFLFGNIIYSFVSLLMIAAIQTVNARVVCAISKRRYSANWLSTQRAQTVRLNTVVYSSEINLIFTSFTVVLMWFILFQNNFTMLPTCS